MTLRRIELTVIKDAALQSLERTLESVGDAGALHTAILETQAFPETASLVQQLVSQNPNSLPLRSIFRVARERYGVSVCLLEYPYIDMEFWDSYSSFYSRSFLPTTKLSKRLFLFTGPSGKSDELRRLLLEGNPYQAITGLGFECVGFVSLRPTKSFNVGRTVLKFDVRSGELAGLPDGDNERDATPFLRGASEQEANLLGARIVINTVPFVQQDPVVGVCATASVWVASQVLAARYDLHKFPFDTITKQALDLVGPDPRAENASYFVRGQSVAEIQHALAKTGAVPLLIVPTSEHGVGTASAFLRNALYAFTESNLPPILLLDKPGNGQEEGHAVAAVGHQLRPASNPAASLSEAASQLAFPELDPVEVGHQYTVNQSVSTYYVHDDAYGPFNRLTFLSPGDPAVAAVPGGASAFRGSPVKLGKRHSAVFDLWGIVAPVPTYVKNSPGLVLADAARCFATVFWQRFLNKNPEYNAVWRVFLVRASEFKQSLAARGYEKPMIEAYATLHLPKYAWLCELTIARPDGVVDVLTQSAPRQIHGEFIYCSTSPIYHPTPLSLRLGPYFIKVPEEGITTANASVLLTDGLVSGASFSQQECLVLP